MITLRFSIFVVFSIASFKAIVSAEKMEARGRIPRMIQKLELRSKQAVPVDCALSILLPSVYIAIAFFDFMSSETISSGCFSVLVLCQRLNYNQFVQ